jgi:hypothetical protein
MQQDPEAMGVNINLVREEQARGVDKLVTFPIDSE